MPINSRSRSALALDAVIYGVRATAPDDPRSQERAVSGSNRRPHVHRKKKKIILPVSDKHQAQPIVALGVAEHSLAGIPFSSTNNARAGLAAIERVISRVLWGGKPCSAGGHLMALRAW